MMRTIKHIYHFFIAIAALVYFRFPGNFLTVIGVTGTDGKTTTTTLIYEILKKAGKKASMITSVHAVIGGKAYDTGFHVTTPTAWHVQKYLRDAVDHGDTYMVLEVTSHGIDQLRVWGIPFTIGVITNVTPEHLDWHKTFDRYMETKVRLLTWAKHAVVNADEAPLMKKVQTMFPKEKICLYGINHPSDVTPKTHPFQTPLPGVFNQYNCLAAISAATLLDIPKKAITEALLAFHGISGRMEVIQKEPYMVIVDFAHTPNAIEKALMTARSFTDKRLIHVFGSAGLRDPYKRPLMGKNSSAYADVIVLTEEDYRTENVETIMDEIQEGIPEGKEVYRYPKRDDAVKFALAQAKKGDVVIITGKGHEQSLCRGTIEYPWSDQEAVKKILQRTLSK
jgi:UDP-N-acetylmuramoyl-L-alanyl-D-glutamate--2,6-diaminopimelate ligase